MLKGLALRQTSLVVIILLMLLSGAVWTVTVIKLRAPRADLGPVSSPPERDLSGNMALADVRPLEDYDLIVNTRLFGNAARWDPSSERATRALTSAQPASDELTEETKLPLTLRGTSVSGERDPFAVAIIEVRQGVTQTKAFYLDQEILPRVFLAEVRRKEVVLDNQNKNRLESLKLERSDSSAQRIPNPRVMTARRRAPSAVSSRPRMLTLDRADITKRLEDEYARLASTIDIRVVKDDKGRVQGVTTDNIESIELANELGFQNGDVLTSINNEPVDSREKAAQIIQKYQNASIFRIGILRNGKPLTINYQVR
ncbi:MAG: type II secretion system protein N [Anaerolineales bacterium]|nr:type II secretion system protein N [Anaerolineales bacterium]